MENKQKTVAVRILLVAAWVAILAWIVVVFFTNRGGSIIFPRRTLGAAAAYYFPLVGLIAFFLVWTQIMIGSMRPWWQRLFPGIMRWHKWTGMFVLLFALLHPLLLLAGVGWNAFFRQAYVSPALVAWVWVGEVQLFLIFITALTALAARIRWLQRRWHTIHLLNYAVFCLVWLHSWFLGADVTHASLRWLWFFFAGTFLIAVTIRIVRSLTVSKAESQFSLSRKGNTQ